MNFLPLIAYLLVMTFSPGPNNVMLASSGANYGFNRTVPALVGMSIGLSVQIGVLTLFLGSLMDKLASFQIYLASAGCLYLLWMALGMVNSGSMTSKKQAQPLGFLGGLVFNWLNPKVWLIGFNLAILFLPQHTAPWQAALVFACLTLLIGASSSGLWAGAGVMIGRLLSVPWRLRLFNGVMALLLAATAFWMLYEVLPANWFEHLTQPYLTF